MSKEELEDNENLNDLNEESKEESIVDDLNKEESNEETEIKTEEDDFDIFFKKTANKHKLEGTHRLKRDTIFLGKVDTEEDPEEKTTSFEYEQNNFEIERGSEYDAESKSYENYFYVKELAEDIYKILDEKTSINFTQNRRKPNRQTFNGYYKMCITDLDTKYTKSEIFVELSYYFTDNIFNMFKLLDKRYATGIIMELKNKGYLKDIGNINFI